MRLFKILLPIFILTILFSCDKIEDPLKEQEGTCGDATIKPIKKILVEDYTGHKCVNCPEAAVILKEIKNDYCDHIIPIAIHVSGFAAPSGTTFTADYRTDVGNVLNDFYGVQSFGLPAGIVSRTSFEENILLRPDDWRSAVHEIFKNEPDAEINIDATYNSTTNKINTNISTTFFKKLDYEINIVVYLTEDSIISPQLTPNGVVEDYIHRHMLRKGINGAFGEKLVSSANVADFVEKNYSFELEDNWNIEHLELIAFISNTETKEIIQAESEHIEH